MSRPVSEMSKPVSSQKIPNAAELREEERELLKQTKEKQSVKNVLQQIKDMEAAEKAKQWRPPAKTGSGQSDPKYVNLSASKPTYMNEVDTPKLPDRNPPKLKEIELPEKKDKNKGVKKLFNFGKGKSSSEDKPYTHLQEDSSQQIYEEISGYYSGVYEIPVEQSPKPTTFKESPTKSKSSNPPTASKEDIEKMSVEDVAQLLKKLGLDKHTKIFKKKLVSGTLLKIMDDDVLVKEFGFTKFDAIKLKTFVDKGHVPE